MESFIFVSTNESLQSPINVFTNEIIEFGLCIVLTNESIDGVSRLCVNK